MEGREIEQRVGGGDPGVLLGLQRADGPDRRHFALEWELRLVSNLGSARPGVVPVTGIDSHPGISGWKPSLVGEKTWERLTSFDKLPRSKASDPVVSDDGKFMAFQMVGSSDPAGLGYGVVLDDFARAARWG